MNPPPAALPGGMADAQAAEVRLQRRALWCALALGALVALTAASLRLEANPVLAAITGMLVLVAWQRQLLAWPTLLGYVIAVILFVPIRRYTVLPGVPIELEPYRILITVVLFAWVLAVLTDPAASFRTLGVEAPIAGFAIAVALSLGLNFERVSSAGLTAPVIKQVSFMVSFFMVMYFAASAVNSRRALDRVLSLLVGGGSVIALLSIVEWRTGYNAFNHLQSVVPVLHLDQASIDVSLNRGFRTRAYASAQHPIALAATLVILLPLAVYLYRRHRQPLWMVAAAALTLGALATGSRTAAIMLVSELVAFFWMKRRETVRLLPMLVPLIVACQVVMPGTLGTFKATLFPESGLVAEQKGGGDSGSGRVADLGPSLEEFSRAPFFGHGFGSRLTSESDSFVNARILDNEWLGVLIEVGAIGALCLLWLYVRTVRLLAAGAKRDETPYGWLLAALGASIVAFPMGMLTYDAFSFIQVTFISFILIGFGAVALRLGPSEDDARAEPPAGTVSSDATHAGLARQPAFSGAG